ncbi:MAG TPA: hypothetical protein VK184_17940 [Nostocaceae cyanobacterium]|nr:hypothetical protein [Nostocaceae cyanobacterium]
MNFRDWEIEAELQRMKRELNLSEDNNFTNQNNSQNLDNVLNKLNDLVGMQNVKDEINTLINFLKVQNMRQKQGLAKVKLSLNSVFVDHLELVKQRLHV